MVYAVSPASAAGLVDTSRNLAAPVDAFIKLYWEYGQPLFGLTPYSVMWGDLRYRTTIGRRERTPTEIKVNTLRRYKEASGWPRRW